VSSDESVEFLYLHTILEKKRLLPLLSFENSSRREDDGGGQQMTPEFLNKAFLTKSTQYIEIP
jgi:hypothetical protein